MSNSDSPQSMDAEIRERREETWNMLVVQGQDYREVVSTIAQKYGKTESAIESDIGRMDNWLPKLNAISQKDGVSRIRELRQNRQRLQRMAREAREDGDIEKELRIRRQIDKAVELDVELSQSLGLTDKEADEVEVKWKDYIGGDGGSEDAADAVRDQFGDE